ncbi:hypothetical protein NPIL_456321 [Nephila pilipes]|uniref:Uncharacterized protein n=1 Tax=Nephila pilipes TaxID=299642 RepID=A0A8X6PCC3_NEPPI|nr:hypothetical protein NPIL_456321 [Nephila pilipes]
MLIRFTQRSLIVNDEVGPMSRPAADPECDPLQPGSIWCGTHGYFFWGVNRSVALKKRMQEKGLGIKFAYFNFVFFITYPPFCLVSFLLTPVLCTYLSKGL